MPLDDLLEARALELLREAQGQTLGDLTDYESLKATPLNAVRAVLGQDVVEALDRGGVRTYTIWVRQRDQQPWETVGLPTLQLVKFAQETWEESELRQQLQRILFVTVESEEKDSSGARILDRAFFWTPDTQQWAVLEDDWKTLQAAVREGKAKYEVLTDDDGKPRVDVHGREKRENALPRGTYLHLRPKGADKSDTDVDPVGNVVTKQALYFNKEFLHTLITNAGKPASPVAAKPRVSTVTRPHLPFGTLAQIALDMRKDSRKSVIANNQLPPLNRALYVEDRLDDAVSRFMESSSKNLLVLTGSAGHGKSAAIAMALEKAKRAGLDLEIRHDASQSDWMDESYADALARFLDQWLAAQPSKKFILGMNLGKALAFFGPAERRTKYEPLAAALNDAVGLGLVDAAPDPRVQVEDMAQRILPELTATSLTIPWFERFLAKFDPASPDSVTKAAFDYQKAAGLGAYDPLVTNVHLVATAAVRRHLINAIAGAIVRHDVHITPRGAMDLISRLILPRGLGKYIGDDGLWTDDGRNLLGSPEKWGARITASMFSELFPREQPAGADGQLADALKRENPAYIRTREMDLKVISWSSDTARLGESIPRWYLDYLGWRPESLVRDTQSGLRTLIQAAAWMGEPTRQPRLDRVRMFLGLIAGERAWQERAFRPIETGIRQYVTRTFFRATEWGEGGRAISLQVHRSTSTPNLRTELGQFDIRFCDVPGNVGIQRQFPLDIVKADTEPIRLNIDWPTFDTLLDVAAGSNPSASAGAASVALSRLQRQIQMASQQGAHLEWTDAASGRVLHLRPDQYKAGRIRGELHDA